MGLATWGSLKIMDLFLLDTTRTLALATVFSFSSLMGLIIYIFSVKILKLDEYRDYQNIFEI